MIAYVLDYRDFSVKDVLEFEQYEFSTDLEYAEKSTIVVARKPVIHTNDFVLCKSGNESLFLGLCEDFAANGDTTEYTITLAQKECLFDRQIIAQGSGASTVEAAIAWYIRKNWITSGDAMMDNTRLTVVSHGSTPLVASIATLANSDKGVFNLKTLLGNVKERYGIYLDFEYTGGGFTIAVNKDESDRLDLNVQHSDVVDCTETLEVNALAKLIVLDGDYLQTKFYLKTDRTITTDANDPDRADGFVKSIEISENTQDAISDAALAEFRTNSYSHKVTLDLIKGSELYPANDLYVGRRMRLKLTDGTIKDSLVALKRVSSEAPTIYLEFGKLAITLIEKLRRL